MKICYYFRHINDPMGQGVHARSLVAAWSRDGHTVMCLPRAVKPGAPGRGIGLGRSVRSLLPAALKHALRQTYCDFRSELEIGRVRQCVEAAHPDVLIARWSQFDHTLDRLLGSLPCPFVAEVNSVIHAEMERILGVRLSPSQRKREIDYLRGAELLICVSEQLREEVIGSGVDPQRCVVVTNGVNSELFRPDVDGDRGVLRWAQGSVGNLVAYCGSPSLVHDMPTLLRAAESVADEVPGSRFLFVGPLQADIRPLIRHRPDLAGRILVTGAVPHERVPSLLAPARLLWGAFSGDHVSPLKVYEYMAMGKPVVVAGAGQAAQIIGLAGCGSSVSRGDHAALAQAAINTLRLPEVARQKLGCAGHEWATSNATWASTAEEMVRVIKEHVLMRMPETAARDGNVIVAHSDRAMGRQG